MTHIRHTLPFLLLCSSCAWTPTVELPRRADAYDSLESCAQAAKLSLETSEWSESYPWRLTRLGERERAERKALVEACNPGWTVSINAHGLLHTARSTSWDSTEQASIERWKARSRRSRWRPGWSSIKDIPPFYQERLSRFIQRNWRLLKLEHRPSDPETRSVHARWTIRQDPKDGVVSGWAARFESFAAPPESCPSALPDKDILKHYAGLTLLGSTRSCIPCQETPHGDTCGCTTTDVGELKLSTADFSLQPGRRIEVHDTQDVMRCLADVRVKTTEEITRRRDQATYQTWRNVTRRRLGSGPPGPIDLITGESVSWPTDRTHRHLPKTPPPGWSFSLN